jgi:hypothetical protein
MQRYILYILVLFILTSCSVNKPFPKRYLGDYVGTQQAYDVQMNGDAVTVPETKYRLTLTYGELWLTSPQQTITGNYQMIAETKMYYKFDVHLGNGIVEEWQLWKKSKNLTRKGIAPQPETIFVAE